MDTSYFSRSRKPLIDRIRVSVGARGVSVSVSIDHDDCGPHSRMEFYDVGQLTIGM